jgi:outer membrane protein assembly factor BamB
MTAARRACAVLWGILTVTIILAARPLGPSAAGADWPQFRGPRRDGISSETGLLKTWPKDGPPQVWKAEKLGGGYSAPAVAGGKVFGMGYRGTDEVVWALDEATGKEVWSHTLAKANTKVGYAEGPRCTPTVDGDRLYVLGVSGDLACLAVKDGQPAWHHNLVTEFGGSVPTWGYSESPLVDGDKVVATPGGRQATIVAFNKHTGEVIWKAVVPQGDRAEYASALAVNLAGVRQYVQFLKGGVVGVAAADGKFLWRYDRPVKAQEVYFTREMKNHHGGMVLLNGYLYGADDPGLLTCLDFKTGRVKWEDRAPGKGSLIAADGMLIFRNEGGPVVLVEASPDGYKERGRFTPPNRTEHNAWSYPVVANGRLYLRDQDTMICYDLRAR